MQGERPLDGCEEPASPGRGAGRRPAGRGPAGVCREPGGARAGGGRLRGSRAVRRLRRRRGAGGAGRGPGGAQMRLRAARYVVRIIRTGFYITTVATSRGRTRIVAWNPTCAARAATAAHAEVGGSHKRKPRHPCARRDGADAPPCTPPIAFPAGAAAAPRVRVCAVLREPQP